MSLTRELMRELRARHVPAETGFVDGVPQKIEAPPIAANSEWAAEAARHTTAMLGVGQVGTRYATGLVLQFQAELAVAHGAVAAVIPDGWFRENGLLELHTQVTDHAQYLLRPDLGRRLNAASAEILRTQVASAPDVQIILADGLSAVACQQSGVKLLRCLEEECRGAGLSVGAAVGAHFARVWLEDEIGALVGAKVAVILLGERPGLGTGDGLSAYMVFDPRIGRTDADRNMISNIHERGTPPPEAARRLRLLAQAMLAQKTSGVRLDLSANAELAASSGGGYRAGQPRVKLVEKP